MKKIVLTGGGTAGHVTPNIAMIEKLKYEGFHIDYIGSFDGIEKQLIEEIDIPYYGISSGKLRRYFSMENFSDMFKVLKGIGDAKKTLKELKPDIVFSKGGFVTVPVIYAAKKLKIPIIIHESDITIGLANKIAIPFATAVCHTFPETKLPNNKKVHTGTPIRSELFSGDKEKGLRFCKLSSDKPVILVMGGSQGSVIINNCLRKSLDELLKQFNIVHLCGNNNLDEKINKDGYVQFEYLKDELSDVMQMADIIVSRAGANSISEFLALKKPNLLIPLSRKASRGDQILNAFSFEGQLFSKVLEEEDMTKESLINSINDLYKNKHVYIESMNKSSQSNGVEEVYKVIKKHI